MKEYEFKVSKNYNGYSAIEFLKEKNVSLEIIKKIKKGGVYVNEKLLLNINEVVKYKDIVKMRLVEDEVNKFATPIKSHLKVLYEDKYFYFNSI